MWRLQNESDLVCLCALLGAISALAVAGRPAPTALVTVGPHAGADARRLGTVAPRDGAARAARKSPAML